MAGERKGKFHSCHQAMDQSGCLVPHFLIDPPPSICSAAPTQRRVSLVVAQSSIDISIRDGKSTCSIWWRRSILVSEPFAGMESHKNHVMRHDGCAMYRMHTRQPVHCLVREMFPWAGSRHHGKRRVVPVVESSTGSRIDTALCDYITNCATSSSHKPSSNSTQ